jgi:hypothetical protein
MKVNDKAQINNSAEGAHLQNFVIGNLLFVIILYGLGSPPAPASPPSVCCPPPDPSGAGV